MVAAGEEEQEAGGAWWLANLPGSRWGGRPRGRGSDGVRRLWRTRRATWWMSTFSSNGNRAQSWAPMSGWISWKTFPTFNATLKREIVGEIKAWAHLSVTSDFDWLVFVPGVGQVSRFSERKLPPGRNTRWDVLFSQQINSQRSRADLVVEL